jgi:hypothetical protein
MFFHRFADHEYFWHGGDAQIKSNCRKSNGGRNASAWTNVNG